MFARHVSMQLKPNMRAEFTQTIENEILPPPSETARLPRRNRIRCPRTRNGNGRHQSLGKERGRGSLPPRELSRSAEGPGESGRRYS